MGSHRQVRCQQKYLRVNEQSSRLDWQSEALEYSEQSLAVAVTPFDRACATDAKQCALVLLRRIDEGAKLIGEQRRRTVAKGDFYTLQSKVTPFLACAKFCRETLGTES